MIKNRLILTGIFIEMGVIEIEYELNKINVFTKSDEELNLTRNIQNGCVCRTPIKVWYGNSLICASCIKQESNNPDILDKEGLTWIIVIYQTLNYNYFFFHFQ